MANATIYDVSQLAKVSIATVSRVLNDPDRVSEKTRNRVIQAIDDLDFVPKSEAVARARKAFGRIGIITATSTVDSFVDRLRGLFDALADLAYEPIIYEVTTNAQRDSYLTSLPSRRLVDGLIIVDLRLDDSVQKRILKHNLPTVQIVSSAKISPNNQLATIVHEDRMGSQLAAGYLLEKGYRRIGYIGDAGWRGPFLDTFQGEKLDGFRQALALSGVPLPDELVRSGRLGMESGRLMAEELLDLDRPPEAIFAASDTLAIGALRAIRQRGLTVPQDMAVIGFDNISVAEYIGLTTIDQQLEKSGRLAIKLLLEQFEQAENGGEVAQKIELPFTLMARETA